MKHFLLALVLAAAPGPTDTLKEADAKMRAFARSPQASTEALAKLSESYIDFSELARRALGDEWERIPPKKRTDFVQTMFAVLRKNYASKALVEGKKDSVIKYESEVVSGNEATVSSSIRSGKDRVPVIYKLHRTASTPWKIYDVVTDDVSLLEDYQGEFRQIISKRGFDGLLQSLKEKQRQQKERGA